MTNLRNKAKNRDAGIAAEGKNIVYQVYEYIKLRIGVNYNYFKNIVIENGKILYELQDKDEAVHDYCKLITQDVSTKFNIQLSYAII